MALKRKKWRARHAHGHDHHRHEPPEKLAERLAPLEETGEFRLSEQSKGKRGGDDTIRVDSSSVKLPEQFAGDERDAAATFRLDPVVVAVLAAVLAFIAFVAWQITLMPAPAK